MCTMRPCEALSGRSESAIIVVNAFSQVCHHRVAVIHSQPMILECHSSVHPDCRCFPDCRFTSFRSVYPDHNRQQQPTRFSFGCTRVALQQQKRAHKRYIEPGWPARSTSLPELPGFISGVCFDQQCQQAADRAFLIVTSIPLLGLLCAVILKYRPPSAEALNKDEVSFAF